ncbi:hypothetical protein QGN23_14475 [Chryseobacterium gotjawalense]|uniref:Uncharacterized protein n=1 Tax=Chryseobacterium gotjawalense TaxID=3042315 RepID=A0ABY8RF25_9FLAO|nr:hypothetical protein [Chryseobacterium sp. wdc7]WHF51609.1 hypothetical protein QGN23_14475 [Chryseobacterium sp. wdc7]
MKSLIKLKYIVLFLITVFVVSCSRTDEDEDVLSQEDISNIILNVKDDATGITNTYNYTVNSTTNPDIKLTDGKTYTVNTVFLNGNEDETKSIIEAKDEHFLLFDFQNSNINLERIDGESSVRSDGNKVGLITKWTVIKARNGTNPQLVLALIHDAVSVSESRNGSTFGSVTGGETDAMATYSISN